MAGAATLDFDSVSKAAIRHSYDVRGAQIDVSIARAQLKEARSTYFPTVGVRFNSQYTKDLTRATTPQVTAVGETVLVRNTLYQDSFSLNASIDLYDFGAREKRAFIVAREIPLRWAVYNQSVRDTKTAVLQAYRDLLVITNDLTARMTLLGLHKDMALSAERLYGAGLASKVDVADQAIKVVKTVDEIDNLKLKLSSSLQDLSLLTGEQYELEGLEVVPFRNWQNRRAGGFDLTASPEYRMYQHALEKKKAEVDALRKESFYPRFGLYSNYVLYGQDPKNYRIAYGDLREHNFSIGLVASMPFFEGFKSVAQIEKAKLEMDRIRIEKEKKISELSNRYQKLKEEERVLEKTIANQRSIMVSNEENSSMTARLAEQKVVDHTEHLKRQIESVIQRHEIVRAETLRTAAAMELEMLTERRGAEGME